MRGDQYVTLIVKTPTQLSERAKEALRAFDEACGTAGSEGGKKRKSFKEKLKEAFDEAKE